MRQPAIWSQMWESAFGPRRGAGEFVVAENEPQESWLLRPSARSGNGIDAMWNDDFHHAAMVALTGRAPFAARGCVAQAWSVAELLRVWHRTASPSD